MWGVWTTSVLFVPIKMHKPHNGFTTNMKDMGDATIKKLDLSWNADSNLFYLYTPVNWCEDNKTKNSILYSYNFLLLIINGIGNCCGKNNYAKSLARLNRMVLGRYLTKTRKYRKNILLLLIELLTLRLIFKRFTITKMQIW